MILKPSQNPPKSMPKSVLFVSQIVGTPGTFPAPFFRVFIVNGDFWDPAGHPKIRAGPKNALKNSIRPFLGAPGRNPRAEKLINGPHGQGALKKSVFW